MIAPSLQEKIGQALKAHEAIRVSTLRLLSSALNYERIAKMHELSHDEELVVVKREAKKRVEAIEIYTKAGDTARADKETQEFNILKEFLPEEMGDQELTEIVKTAILAVNGKTKADMGLVMKEVMIRLKGQVDGKRVSDIVLKLLQ